MIIIVMILIPNNMMPILNPSDLYLAYESCRPLLTSGDSIRNALAKEKNVENSLTERRVERKTPLSYS